MENDLPPQDEFDHFILTRFNTRLGERASEQWLRHRIGYFEDICRQSVLAQTNKNFQWLIFFDSERDNWFQEEIDRLSEGGAFEPIWVDGELTPEKAVAAVIERAAAPWLITTRVDNDDALAANFVDSVQKQFLHQEFEFINFQAGLQMSQEGEVYHRSDPYSPFISLIERRTSSPFKGIYIGRHDRISDFGPVRQVSTHPMWLQMVHGLNIGNAMRGVRANPKLVARYFDIGLNPSEVSGFRLRVSQIKTLAQLGVHVARKPHRIGWVLKVATNRVLNKSSHSGVSHVDEQLS